MHTRQGRLEQELSAADPAGASASASAAPGEGRPRLIAFYLPQYHPIPENDQWWGAGFTEWTSVTRARPLFPGHYQPHLPADLGFYDLRLPETREAQATLARQYGIHGFCYYHYWFNGRRLLHRPFDEVLASGRPDLPFCLCWANENWTRAWDGLEREVLLEQRYSEEDDRAHIRWLARAFADPRYIRVQDRPLFLIYRATRLPDPRRTTTLWREEAARLGIKDLFLGWVESLEGERTDLTSCGFDAAVEFQPDWPHLGPSRRRSYPARLRRLIQRLLGIASPDAPQIHDYPQVVRNMLAKPPVPYLRYPCVTPSWDNTARRRNSPYILDGSDPQTYGHWLRETLNRSMSRPPEHRIVFVNAWNEWAEGNHLEPDQKWGRAYLEATLQALQESTGADHTTGPTVRARDRSTTG